MQFAGQNTALAELLRYRQLLLSLTWRDLRVRYKQSLLGMAWALLLPLAMMLIFTFVFTRAVKVTHVLDLGMPYPLFAYLGLVPWAFFSASLNGAVNSLVANRTLVTKVYFPREVFPLASVGSALVDFGVASAMLVVLLIYFDLTAGTWHFVLHPTLLFVPVILLVQVLLTCGLGMLLAMGNLFFRDVRQLFSVFIQMWMFLTCVVYPIQGEGRWCQLLATCNPMTPIIQAYRDCIINGCWPGRGFLIASGIALVVFLAGWAWFRRLAHKFAECI